jgi:thiamine pyrophosphate-dependent acetolactate synthase large subunit-like protein
LAEWIAAAERPLIVTAALPAEAMPVLERLAERCAIPSSRTAHARCACPRAIRCISALSPARF